MGCEDVKREKQGAQNICVPFLLVYLYIHIPGTGRRRRFHVEHNRAKIKLKVLSSGEGYYWFGGTDAKKLRKRGEVSRKMSEKSGRRLVRYLQNCKSDYRLMVTLTYPVTYGYTRALKGHLDELWRYIKEEERFQVDAPKSMCWFLEYQRRGVPHYHGYISGWEYIAHERIAQMWVVATGGVADVRAGTRIEEIGRARKGAGLVTSEDRRKVCAYYAHKYAVKEAQKEAPEGDKQGRWWGVKGERGTRPDRLYLEVKDKDEEVGIVEQAYVKELVGEGKEPPRRVLPDTVKFARVAGAAKEGIIAQLTEANAPYIVDGNLVWFISPSKEVDNGIKSAIVAATGLSRRMQAFKDNR